MITIKYSCGYWSEDGNYNLQLKLNSINGVMYSVVYCLLALTGCAFFSLRRSIRIPNLR